MQYVHAHTFNVFYMYFIRGTNDNKDIICEGFEHKPQIFSLQLWLIHSKEIKQNQTIDE